jgi:hypothetical protein
MKSYLLKEKSAHDCCQGCRYHDVICKAKGGIFSLLPIWILVNFIYCDVNILMFHFQKRQFKYIAYQSKYDGFIIFVKLMHSEFIIIIRRIKFSNVYNNFRIYIWWYKAIHNERGNW